MTRTVTAPEKSTIVRSFEFALIRQFEATDLPGIHAMSDHLSAGSLYQRFFAGTPAIPHALLRQLARLDHDHRDAVVAVADGRVVGLAQYARERPGQAELGVLVVDDWQHRGVGRALVTALAQRALSRGITEFTASVLPDNKSALRGLARLGPDAVGTPDDGTLLYHLPLARFATAVPAAPVRSPGESLRCETGHAPGNRSAVSSRVAV